VRELCRRDGKLTAAVARNGSIPLHGVLTVIPKNVDPYVLVAILNSTVAANYVKMHAASFSKVDFQKITVNELRKLPIPTLAVQPSQRRTLGLQVLTRKELLLQTCVIRFARALASSGSVRQRKTTFLGQLDAAVTAMYGYARGSHA
jgi:hypothetical protein